MKFYKALIKLILASLFVQFLVPNYANAKNEVGISKTEIVLGATFPKTGPLSPYFQDFFTGAQAYFDYVNSKGGIQGRKIRLITRDDKGLPSIAVTQVNALILADKVFALFNSVPFTAGHVPMLRAAAIDTRQIPNLAVTTSFSGLTDSSKYQTTFQATPNAKQDFKILTHFIEQSLGSTPINVSYPDDDIGRDFEQVMTNSSRKYSKIGSSNPGCPGIPFIQKDFGVLSLWRWFCGDRQGSQKPVLVTSDSFPLIILGSSISSSSGAYLVASTKSNNVYTNFSLPLYTDTQDPFIQFFTQVFKEFAPNRHYDFEIQINDESKSAFNYVSQQMYEGANSAYVISQAIAALGPEPTRAALIAFLRSNSKSLSSATFSPIDYSLSSNIGDTVQYIAKYDGSKWVKVSDYYLVNASGTSIKVTAPQRSSLLPGGLPVATVTEKSLVKIKCVKGKVTKQVTGINPKCPTGYKRLN
jgi:ABC-type branched-subunit amino acid transport system substrate-binding protein